ncbi:hypothetical protein HMPREF9372_0886 [Sporosarcina newyorkensis 2681]|uniref:Uncharacterized protein n=1 Tax=Sporosarcina newyorkensis 2681 TaxID=1027292 RepID=F9DQ06_9BACL|nr:hypothetical protein HMPREF9372_0886 [Sporosarcina newyorkensis 2681]
MLRGFALWVDAFRGARGEPPRSLRFLRGLTCRADPAGVATRRSNPYFLMGIIVAYPLKILSDKAMCPYEIDQSSKANEKKQYSQASCS